MNPHGLHLSPYVLLIGLIGACLPACGGGDDDTGAPGSEGDVHALLHVVEPISTLLADDGSIMPSAPDTVPADPAAHTRAGRYASSRQAEQLERALGDKVILVSVECYGIDGVNQAIGLAYGRQRAGRLLNSAPMLVRSADLRLGAAAVNRLSDAGYGSVWLVTR